MESTNNAKIPFYEEVGICVYISLSSYSINCALALNLERFFGSIKHSKKIPKSPSKQKNVLMCFTARGHLSTFLNTLPL